MAASSAADAVAVAERIANEVSNRVSDSATDVAVAAVINSATQIYCAQLLAERLRQIELGLDQVCAEIQRGKP